MTYKDVTPDRRLAVLALVCLLGLIVLCVLWETVLAPLKPGGTLMLLKALPLAFAVRGVSRGSLYTMQWSSMLVLLYLMEGVVRAMSDPPGLSRPLAWIEILLSVTFFVSAILYVRPAKRAAKHSAKQAAQQPAHHVAHHVSSQASKNAAKQATAHAADQSRGEGKPV